MLQKQHTPQISVVVIGFRQYNRKMAHCSEYVILSEAAQSAAKSKNPFSQQYERRRILRLAINQGMIATGNHLDFGFATRSTTLAQDDNLFLFPLHWLLKADSLNFSLSYSPVGEGLDPPFTDFTPRWGEIRVFHTGRAAKSARRGQILPKGGSRPSPTASPVGVR